MMERRMIMTIKEWDREISLPVSGLVSSRWEEVMPLFTLCWD
jgi:hypothetical protein